MYNIFYNLNSRPFGLNPDLKFFYISHPLKKTIVDMRVGFEQPDGVFVLTGEKGMGKTTLITYMLDQLDKNDNIVAFIQNPPQKLRDFLPAILAALQIPITDNQPNALFNTLHEFAIEQARLDKKVLLVVDDAQRLPQNCFEFIRLLSTLLLNEHGLLQIVLAGTNKLDEILSANENQSLRQRISMSCRILPLQDSETREYIEHRLKVAGWNGDPVIDEDAFGAVHRLTGGVPYEINRYCDRLLMLGMLRETHQLNSKDVSSLTLTTMEKLESLEGEWQEQEKKLNESPKAFYTQPLPPHWEPKNAAPVQHAMKDVDFDNDFFNRPTRNAKPLLSKQTKFVVATLFLVSSLAIVVFTKMSPNNLSTASHATHSEVKEDTAVESGTVAHESESETAKYVLEEMSAESIAETNLSGAAEIQLLDIQKLLNKSTLGASEVKSDQTDENLASEATNNASGTSSDAPETTTEAIAE